MPSQSNKQRSGYSVKTWKNKCNWKLNPKTFQLICKEWIANNELRICKLRSKAALILVTPAWQAQS